MPLRHDILDAIAYPDNVGGVPTRIFGISMMLHGALGIAVKDMAQGLAFIPVLGSFAALHFFVWKKFREDPHIEKVWKEKFLPPDFRRARGRRFLRRRTVNLRSERGRKFVT